MLRWGARQRKRLESWLETHRAARQPAAQGPLAAALPAFTAALENDLNVSGAIGADGVPDGTITPTTSYRVQIAVWRWHKWNFVAQGDRDGMYDIKGGAATPTGKFTAGEDGTTTAGEYYVDFDDAIHNAHANGYIRADGYGVWLQIDRIGDDSSNDKHSENPRVYLVAPFRHPGMAAGDTMTVQVSMANTLRLVGLYDGYVTPPSMRAAP